MKVTEIIKVPNFTSLLNIRLALSFYLALVLLSSCQKTTPQEIQGYWYSVSEEGYLRLAHIDDSIFSDCNYTYLTYRYNGKEGERYLFNKEIFDQTVECKLQLIGNDSMKVFDESDSLLHFLMRAKSENVIQDMLKLGQKDIHLPDIQGEFYSVESLGAISLNSIVTIKHKNDELLVEYMGNDYDYESALKLLPSQLINSTDVFDIYIVADKHTPMKHIVAIENLISIAGIYNLKYVLKSDVYGQISSISSIPTAPNQARYDSLSIYGVFPPPPLPLENRLVRHGIIIKNKNQLTTNQLKAILNEPFCHIFGVAAQNMSYSEYLEIHSEIILARNELRQEYTLEMFEKTMVDSLLSRDEKEDVYSKFKFRVVPLDKNEIYHLQNKRAQTNLHPTLVNWLSYHELDDFGKLPVSNTQQLEDAYVAPAEPEVLPEDFQSFWIYSPDSAWFIDMDSYSTVLEKRGNDIYHLGSEVDTKVTLSRNNLMNWQVLFCGTACAPETAFWASNREFVILGYTMTDDGDGYVPTKWSSEDVFNHIDIQYSMDTLESWKPGYIEKYRLPRVIFDN